MFCGEHVSVGATVSLFIRASVLVFLVCLLPSCAKAECIHDLTEDSDTFQTPGFPDEYPNNVDCLWKISVKPGHYVALSFDVFEVESYQKKCIDVVEVKDGNSITSELLGSFCSDKRPPKVITSSGNVLRVWFYSDSSYRYHGFNATYTSHKETDCGGELAEPSGILHSPRFPRFPYPSNQDCTWTINVPQGQFVRLTQRALQTEFKCSENGQRSCSCVDKLEIWDGAEGNETKLGTYCATMQPVWVSKSNRVKLRFYSNSEGRFRGFQMSYTTSPTPGCGGDMQGDRGGFVSPNYPLAFPSFSDCIWRIKTVKGKYLSLRFPQFLGINGTNQECSADSLDVRDGDNKESALLGSYCTQNPPPVIISSGNQLYIHLRSRQRKSQSQNRLFSVIYISHSRECNASLGLEDGRIHNSELSASSYSIRRIGSVQFSLAPSFGRLNGPYGWCSQEQGYNMAVGEYFQIDLLNLTMVTAVATQGHYPPAARHIDFVASFKVDFSYEGSYWIAYSDNSKNNSNKEFTEFKGNFDASTAVKNVFTIPIIANMIRIIPLAYRSYPYSHMCLRAELYGCPYSIKCGGTFSPMKPDTISIRGFLDKPRDCTWISKPTPPSIGGLVMIIRFSYFDVPCNHGKVLLHDRMSGRKSELCGADPPPVYAIRASSQLLVGVSLKAGMDVAGIDIKYKTETFGCGDVIFVTGTGNLTSPDYPKPYTTSESCTWILEANPESKIALEFNDLDMQPSNGSQCLDYVEIRDGQLDTSLVLGKYCGNDLPENVTSSSHYLRVMFYSDDWTTAKGFHVTYQVIEPNGNEKPQEDTPIGGGAFYSGDVFGDTMLSGGVGLGHSLFLVVWILVLLSQM